MFTVDEIMTTELRTLRGNNTVADARNMMTKEHIRHIPIVDEHGALEGLVTQRDVLVALASAGDHSTDEQCLISAPQITLSEIMTREVSSVESHVNLRQAAIYLQAHKYGCLPVVENGKLIGIVTETDFVALAINLLEQLEEQEPVDSEPVESIEELDDVDLPMIDKDWD